jgi:hypothetical protein
MSFALLWFVREANDNNMQLGGKEGGRSPGALAQTRGRERSAPGVRIRNEQRSETRE